MAPRAKASDAVEGGAKKGKKKTAASESQDFTLDRTPVVPLTPNDPDHDRQLKLDLTIRNSLAGYTQIDVLALASQIKFQNGYSVELSKNNLDDKNLPVLDVHAGVKMFAASGQHRIHTLKKLREKLVAEEKEGMTALNRLYASKNMEDTHRQQCEEWRQKVGRIKGQLETFGIWGVVVYHQGFASRRNEAVQCLSTNKTLYEYLKTDEDTMVQNIRELINARETSDDVFEKMYTTMLQDAKGMNSKMSRVFSSKMLMCLLSLGTHFRQMPQMTLAFLEKQVKIHVGVLSMWVQEQFAVFQMLASPDDFPSLEDVEYWIGLVRRADGDEPRVHLGPDFAIYESFRSHDHVIEGATTPKGRDAVRYYLDGLRRATRDLDIPRRTERSRGTGATGRCGSVSVDAYPWDDADRESQDFTLDRTPVVPLTPNDPDHDRQLKLDLTIRNSLAGYAQIDVLALASQIEFQKWNDRPIDEHEATKLMNSMKATGIKRFSPEAMIPLVVSSSGYSVELSKNNLDDKNLPVLDVNAGVKMFAASGQHRIHALKKLREKLVAEEKEGITALNRLYALKNVEDTHRQQCEEWRQKVGRIKGELETFGMWGVVVYHQEVLLREGTEAAQRLSTNKTLYEYLETDEDTMVQNIRELINAREIADDVFERTYTTMLQDAKGMNSKMSRVFSSKMTVVMLMCLLSLGTHFRQMPQMTLAFFEKQVKIHVGVLSMWVQEQFAVFQMLASPDDFPSLEDVEYWIGLVRRADGNAEPYRQFLANASANMMKATKGSVEVFWPLLKLLDDKADDLVHFGDGDDNERWQSSMNSYWIQVYRLMKKRWSGALANPADPDHSTYNCILSRVALWSSGYGPLGKKMPGPLLTVNVFDAAVKILESLPLSLSEVARWFDPLVDYARELVRSQLMADYTESIFLSIRNLPYLKHPDEVARTVYKIIWGERHRNLLRLEYRLHRCPPTVPRVVVKKALEAAVKEDPTMLKDSQALLEHIKGLVTASKKASSSKRANTSLAHGDTVKGYPEIRASLWTWKDTSAKASTRDLQPIMQAMIQELAVVASYRPRLMNEAVVAFRGDLYQAIVEDDPGRQEITTQRGLVTVKNFSWWDKVPVPDSPRGIPSWQEGAKASFTLRRRIIDQVEILEEHRKIQALVNTIERSPLSVNNATRKVASEVSRAVTALIKAWEINGDRSRFFRGSDDQDLMFDPEDTEHADDYARAETLPDPRTIGADDLDESDEDSVDAMDTEEVEEQPTSTRKGKERARGSKPPQLPPAEPAQGRGMDVDQGSAAAAATASSHDQDADEGAPPEEEQSMDVDNHGASSHDDVPGVSGPPFTQIPRNSPSAPTSPSPRSQVSTTPGQNLAPPLNAVTQAHLDATAGTLRSKRSRSPQPPLPAQGSSGSPETKKPKPRARKAQKARGESHVEPAGPARMQAATWPLCPRRISNRSAPPASLQHERCTSQYPHFYNCPINQNIQLPFAVKPTATITEMQRYEDPMDIVGSDLEDVDRPDDDGLQGPFHLGDVPDGLEAEDPASQTSILAALRVNGDELATDGPKFDEQKLHNLSLGFYKRCFKLGDAATAVNALRKRVKLTIDDTYKVATDSDKLVWDASKHFLDFFMVVSRSIGLHAVLPNIAADHNFKFTLNLRQSYREFRSKFGKLGFNPTGSMMAIGQCGGLEVWLGFPLFDDGEPEEAPKARGDTRLTAKRHRMVVMFFAHVLSRMPTTAIHLLQPYGRGDDFGTWSVDDVSNIFDADTLELTLDDTRLLHNRIVDCWDDWVTDAPRSWKEDSWLTRINPLSIACKYGQNQPIVNANAGVVAVEAANWDRERDYKNIRYVSMAIASHLTHSRPNVRTRSCKQVLGWVPKPVETIVQAFPVLYDSPNPNVRQVVDLNDYPLHDPNTNLEMNVYDPEGRRVPRLRCRVAPNTLNCGILINLDTVHDLFADFAPEDPDMMLVDEDAIRNPDAVVSVFPQAFLRKYGHVQASTVLPQFTDTLNGIRTSIAAKPNNHDDDDDDDDDELPDPNQALLDPTSSTSRVLSPVASQFYNELSHRVRPTAALHDVQQGRITATLAGAYARTPKAKASHQKLLHQCQQSLPHKKFRSKIDLPDVPRALRLENVFVLDLDHVDPPKRKGRTVVVPLARTWSHPTVFEALKPHLLVLTPDVFPNVYLWTTYSICALLEGLWEQAELLMNQGKAPPPHMVELCAALERALTFAHTGNAKVLATGLMRPMWLVPSIIEDGLPSLAPNISVSVLPGLPCISLRLKDWPVLTSHHVPAVASKCSQVRNYGQSHFDAYEAEFRIQISIAQPPTNVFTQLSPKLRQAAIIAHLALTVYLNDVKALVITGVTKECVAAEATGDAIAAVRAKERRGHLKKWSALKQPLGYADKARERLIKCVVEDIDDDELGNLPPADPDKLSVNQFAKKIYSMTKSDQPTPIQAPILSTGSAPAVFKVATPYMERLAPSEGGGSARENFCVGAMVMAANALQICCVPWHAAGGRARKPVFDRWVNLVKEAGRPGESQGLEARNVDRAREVAQRDQRADARASWSVNDFTLQSLPEIMSRTVPPDELSIAHAGDLSDDAVTRETYEWAMANFDLSKPVCSLAMLAGILVCKCLPDLFFAEEDKPSAQVVRGTRDITNAVRNMPWKPNANGRKGAILTKPFAVMVPVYVFAVCDKRSPLRAFHSEHRKFPVKWNKKHSHKGIGPVNLVRLGLAVANSHRVTKAPVPMVDWAPLSEAALVSLHQQVLTELKDSQHGPYRVTAMFVGEEKARHLARVNKECFVPRTVVNAHAMGPIGSSSSTSRKRPADEANESDEELEEIVARATGGKRRSL
ncbi:hypothetical protein BV22DRAFT_1179673 [Leucogyrophana mollusca]|uniref:Uncharacterized protein n=1 Tax=Leucogyrophana mollusca TaxID=85980 RepID=A0ACB8B657_9AGAM|nr:hypothetical protein BV22DRAFT_1179673 [Leucogyrophana mollusca]